LDRRAKREAGPVSELAAWKAAPVSVFLASIGAFAITAPAGSATVPVIVPRSDWAKTTAADASKHMETNLIRIVHPLLSEVPLRRPNGRLNTTPEILFQIASEVKDKITPNDR